MKNRAVELVLHILVFPDCAGGEAVAAAFQLHQRGAFVVTRRDKEAVVVDDDRLRHVDAHARVPRIAPEHRAGFRCETNDARRAYDDDLPASREVDQHRRDVRLSIVE